MTKSRTIVLIGSAGLVLLLLVAWFLLLAPRMSKAGGLNAERDQLVQQAQTTQSDIATLEQQKAALPQAEAQAAVLSKKFPPTADEPGVYAQIKAAAAAAGLPERAVTDITLGVPVLGTTAGAVTLPTTPAPTDTSSTTTDSSSATTDPNAAPAAPAAPVAPAAPAAPASQLGTMSVSLTVAAPQRQIVAFLKALENMDRAINITSVTVGGGAGTAGSASIEGTMYLLPTLTPTAPGGVSVPAAAPAAAAQTPAATPTVTATPKPKPAPSPTVATKAAAPTKAATPTRTASPSKAPTLTGSPSPSKVASPSVSASTSAAPTAGTSPAAKKH